MATLKKKKEQRTVDLNDLEAKWTAYFDANRVIF